MARQKTPLAKARLTGAAAKNPQRYRGRSEPEAGAPVGNPPAYLSAEEKAFWRQFCDELLWLRISDRAILAATCILRNRLHKDPNPTIAALREFRAHLGALGATPVDRQRVQWNPPEDDDPNDPLNKFLQ